MGMSLLSTLSPGLPPGLQDGTWSTRAGMRIIHPKPQTLPQPPTTTNDTAQRGYFTTGQCAGCNITRTCWQSPVPAAAAMSARLLPLSTRFGCLHTEHNARSDTQLTQQTRHRQAHKAHLHTACQQGGHRAHIYILILPSGTRPAHRTPTNTQSLELRKSGELAYAKTS